LPFLTAKDVKDHAASLSSGGWFRLVASDGALHPLDVSATGTFLLVME